MAAHLVSHHSTQTRKARIAELERGLSLVTRSIERLEDEYGGSTTNRYTDQLHDLENQKTLVYTLLENERLKETVEDYQALVAQLREKIDLLEKEIRIRDGVAQGFGDGSNRRL